MKNVTQEEYDYIIGLGFKEDNLFHVFHNEGSLRRLGLVPVEKNF